MTESIAMRQVGARDRATPRYRVELIRDIRIPTDDPDVTLSADMYRPLVNERVPALIQLLPYRKDASGGSWHSSTLHAFAERGYASLLVDIRGTGSSDGLMRQPLDAEDAEDGVASVDWVAAQPWCNGNVGMWGFSYGAVTSLQTARRNPEPLKAIVPYSGPVDPARDVFHPGGSRGGWLAVSWGTTNLGLQLLPPLQKFHDIDEQERWRRRISDSDPYIVNLFGKSPDNGVWCDSAISLSDIKIPTFCIGGWQDVAGYTMVEAFERIDAPKKLVMGPWMHTMPHDAEFQPVDFVELTIPWWDHWLNGIDTGLMTEPSVALYVQGAGGGWHEYDSWPPKNNELKLAANRNGVLREPPVECDGDVVAHYVPDATAGTLSAPWRAEAIGSGTALDQHDDDLRGFPFTSEPLESAITVSGRPRAYLYLSSDSKAAAQRIVVRVAGVSPNGRSTHISSGVGTNVAMGELTVVELAPTAHRLDKGDRIRMVVSGSDFPLMWPVVDTDPLDLTHAELHLYNAVSGNTVRMPAASVDGADSLLLWNRPSWRIARDLLNEGVTYRINQETAGYTPAREHYFETLNDTCASVRRGAPAGAVIESTSIFKVYMDSGERVEVRASGRQTQSGLWASGQVSIDGTILYSKNWMV